MHVRSNARAARTPISNTSLRTWHVTFWTPHIISPYSILNFLIANSLPDLFAFGKIRLRKNLQKKLQAAGTAQDISNHFTDGS